METTIPKGWTKIDLGSIFDFKNGLNKEKKYFGQGFPIVNYTDVYNNNDFVQDDLVGKVEVNESELKRYEVKTGDVFFTRTSETIDEIGFCSVATKITTPTVFSGFVLRAREKRKTLEDGFKKYCFSTHQSRKEIMRKSSMTTRALTSGKHLSEVEILVPPIKEQKQIADILSTWDRAIELKEKELQHHLIEKENVSKKIVREYSERFGNNNSKKLRSYLKKKTTKVGKRDIEPVAVGVFGIRKRSEIFDKELSKDYSKNKVIEQNDLCFGIGTNKIVYDVLFDDARYCVSPAYRVYEIVGCDPYYLKTYLDTYNAYFSRKYMIISARQGKSIEMSGLLNEKFKLPPLKVQKQVSEYLMTLDKYINKLNEELSEIKKQKKGLMQRLLTGQLRVQI